MVEGLFIKLQYFGCGSCTDVTLNGFDSINYDSNWFCHAAYNSCKIHSSSQAIAINHFYSLDLLAKFVGMKSDALKL